MNCPHCGSKLAPGEDTCRRCGFEVTKYFQQRLLASKKTRAKTNTETKVKTKTKGRKRRSRKVPSYLRPKDKRALRSPPPGEPPPDQEPPSNEAESRPPRPAPPAPPAPSKTGEAEQRAPEKRMPERPQTSETPASGTLASGTPVASTFDRGVAYGIDLVLVTVVATVVAYVGGVFSPLASINTVGELAALTLVQYYAIGLYVATHYGTGLVYFFLADTVARGQTFGQKLLGLHAVRRKKLPACASPTATQAAGNALVKAHVLFVVGDLLLGWVTRPLDALNQVRVVSRKIGLVVLKDRRLRVTKS